MATESITNPIGLTFVQLNETESTNIHAMQMLRENMAAHGTAYFATTQTKGKGQRGKVWAGEAGNIYLSVVIDASFLSIDQQFSLSIAVALAVHDFFSLYAGDETKIKWPNDIYWNDRKAGGILIENVIRGSKWQGSVVGIGININQTTFHGLKNPVSLKQITGKDFDAELLAKKLCVCLETRYLQLRKGDITLLNQYNERLFKKDQSVKLIKENVVSECIVEGVNEHGELLVSNALQDKFVFGEVEWILNEVPM